MRLSSREFARLQRATLALYSHRDLQGFRAAAPGILLAAIPADHCSLLDVRIDLVNRRVRFLDLWESSNSRVLANSEKLEALFFDHPFTQHAISHDLAGRAMILSDFLPMRELRRTRLYREGLKPADIGRVMSIGTYGGPGIAAITLARRESRADFSEADRSLLEALNPHFEQARRNLERETLLRANRERSLKAHGLTPRETEVALWLAQGKSNPEIAAILTRPVRTVEKHVERILEKMGVENRAAAAVSVAEIVRA